MIFYLDCITAHNDHMICHTHHSPAAVLGSCFETPLHKQERQGNTSYLNVILIFLRTNSDIEKSVQLLYIYVVS